MPWVLATSLDSRQKSMNCVRNSLTRRTIIAGLSPLFMNNCLIIAGQLDSATREMYYWELTHRFQFKSLSALIEVRSRAAVYSRWLEAGELCPALERP